MLLRSDEDSSIKNHLNIPKGAYKNENVYELKYAIKTAAENTQLLRLWDYKLITFEHKFLYKNSFYPSNISKRTLEIQNAAWNLPFHRSKGITSFVPKVWKKSIRKQAYLKINHIFSHKLSDWNTFILKMKSFPS